ncbi:hypothetical protein MGH68_10445 [Erysipelothrix sp. D19-032]
MLEHARFEVKFSSVNLNQSGHDSVQFYVGMNKGEDLAPLDKVASGGELSRPMLGLKVIFSRVQHIDTIVFDEIDTGVSWTCWNANRTKNEGPFKRRTSSDNYTLELSGRACAPTLQNIQIARR